MPKSKTKIKRRKKMKGKSPSRYSDLHEGCNLGREYMKTDGKSRVCVYDKNHKFLRFATEEESDNF